MGVPRGFQTIEGETAIGSWVEKGRGRRNSEGLSGGHEISGARPAE